MELTSGQYIATHRIMSGLSQRKLAKLVGCSHVFIGDMERDQHRCPPRWIDPLCKALPSMSATQLILLSKYQKYEVSALDGMQALLETAKHGYGEHEEGRVAGIEQCIRILMNSSNYKK